MERHWQSWFEAMTDDEQVQFVDATAPSGFQQMLASFEDLPEERRRTAIGDAIRHLKEVGAGPAGRGGFWR